jgi:fatty-acyl-CoA synthase
MITADILGERARITPEAVALVEVATGRRLTYGELDARATACARAWTGLLRLVKGDRVAILAGNRVEYVDAFFAAARTGLVLVPLNTRLTVAELSFILANCRARVLLFDREHAEVAGAAAAGAGIESMVSLDTPASGGAASLPDLLAGLAPGPLGVARCQPEDTCCLLYTSGTTGRPKGVIVPHRMVGWNAYNTAISWQLRDDDVAPVYTPLYHAGGLGVFLLPLMATGGTLVLHPRFDADAIWRTVARERCTVVFGVPTIFTLLMDAPGFASTDLACVRFFISGGAPLPLHIIEAYQARGVAFKQGYGLTEVGVNCFAMTVADSVRKAGSVGRPMMFTEARLAGDEGAEVADGDVGELCLRGPHVCNGYWENPEATAAARDADGWFRTGDLARRDTEGFYYIAGRKKDMLISGGVNVYPAEIEGALVLHPDVRDAAVVGVPHGTWGEVGVAFVVPRPGCTPTAEDLSGFLVQRLARYKVPKAFVLVESLPRTAYGKVVKGELRDRYLGSGPPLG